MKIYNSSIPNRFKKIRRRVLFSITFVFSFAYPFALFAQVSLPPVNLGATSFFDGLAGPGTLIEGTLIPYTSNSVVDDQGNKLPISSKIRNLTSMLLIAHITENTVLGGFYGFEVLIPLVDLDVDVNGRNKNSGVGDILLSPLILQWSNKKIFGLPFNHRLNFLFSLPLGSYSSNESLNIGTNTFSFNPYYAFTIEPSEKVEISFRLHYLWNEKNNSPDNQSHAETTQAGEAFHMNFATSYKLTEHIRIGPSGYYLRQLSAHKINDISQINSKESVLGIGAGIQYQSKRIKVVLNAYTESKVENRSKGHRFILKASKVF